MAQGSVLAQMLQVVRDYPHLMTHYVEDFLVHDMRKILASKVGDQFMWVIRECGTDLYPATEAFDIVKFRQESDKSLVWRLITISSVQDHLIGGHVDRLNKETALDVATRKQVKKGEV